MAAGVLKRRSRSRPYRCSYFTALLVLFISDSPVVRSLHHMKRILPEKHGGLVKRQSNTPLVVTNNCGEDIYPGITTQSGTGPDSTGFKLSPGDQNNLTVSENWQGRVWGRTNCSFNSAGTGPANNSPGRACGTGDCNGILNCKVTGDTPVTLAEFTLDGGDGQTYFDISLVDGYNLPIAIVLQPLGNSSFMAIPPNLTSPSCVATAGLLAAQNFNPYSSGSGSQQFLGTNSTDPLPFETKTSDSDVANWCPWDLQVNTPTGPSGGVYAYPDTSIQRPQFDPCYSACAKYNDDADCCTGSHGSPQSCQPSAYSKAAKGVCPDAYSYAFDDQSSTFVIPAGAGFQVIFCPGGRSTNIFSASAPLVSELASTGQVSRRGAVRSQPQAGPLDVAAPKSQGATVGVGETAGQTLLLMAVALALTASVFVML